jgi:cholesterol transport system auxiliary component
MKMIATLDGIRAPSAPLTVRFRNLSLRAALLAVAALASMTSCSILPKRDPMVVYEPARGTPSQAANIPKASWSLLVARPVAGELYETDSITVRPTPGAVQIYKGAIWSDSVPNLVQSALVMGFEDSQKILTVARPGGAVRGEYQLVTELRAFDSIYNAGRPEAVVEVHAKLVHSVDGEVVAAHTFRETEPASSTEIPAVVDAFSGSLDRVTSQIVGWTLTNGNRYQAGLPAKPAY